MKTMTQRCEHHPDLSLNFSTIVATPVKGSVVVQKVKEEPRLTLVYNAREDTS